MRKSQEELVASALHIYLHDLWEKAENPDGCYLPEDLEGIHEEIERVLVLLDELERREK